MKIFIKIALMSLLIISVSASGTVRVKDIAKFQQDNMRHIFGYGLVVGLDGTGDSRSTRFTVQSLVNMMDRMGITVDVSQVKVKNVAAVMVTAELGPHLPVGSRIDIMVSSVGDASSLQGGTLLFTPLADATGDVFAVAQGPISIGGFNVSSGLGDQIQNNYTLVGRIPGGATIEQQLAIETISNTINLCLNNPDFTTASRLAKAINLNIGGVNATPISEANVEIDITRFLANSGKFVDLYASVEKLEIVPDVPARVAINEKTGTIVAGQHVTISSVMLAHGNLNVEIKSNPLVSQPQPFSQGKTVLTRESEIEVDPEIARILHIKQQASIGDLAEALNEIGATPRDIIAIFQALKAVGSLRAEIVVL